MPQPAACHSLDFPRRLAVEITHAPAASHGGLELLERIEGRVNDSKPEEQTVVYAHAGT